MDGDLWVPWKERLVRQRLERRLECITGCLQRNKQHWEETAWWLLARSFGAKVNAGPFEAIAWSLPVAILYRHKDQVQLLEALFLGQAGLLEKDFRGEYARSLQKEFRYLRRKYRLSPIHQPVLFLRMRPYNIPSIRLAQLAMLSHQAAPWWARIKETNSLAELKMAFNITAGSYWDRHYVPDEWSAFKRKKLGLQMTESILINTAVPLLFAYGRLRKEPAYIDRALQWLSSMKAENNSITGNWGKLGVRSKNASGSQALLELKARYCDQKKCLECAIGNALLSYQG